MENKFSHEKILIIIALALSSIMVLYNAFFIPAAKTPSVIYVDSTSQPQGSESSEENDTASTSSSSSSSESKTQANNTQGTTAKVNLNTATESEFSDNLPGIGPTLAKRIIEYRNTYGKFSSIDEIKNVSGIGEKIYENIKSQLSV